VENLTPDQRCIDPDCDHCAWNEALAMRDKEQPTSDQVFPMECGNIYAKVVVPNGIICIREEDEDHESEVYMEYDEARALRNWLDRVLSEGKTSSLSEDK
jgi:hypothetical protein